MPKRDTPAKIVAELRGFASGTMPYFTYAENEAKLYELADRLEAIKPGPVKGWWRQWFFERGKWFANPIAFEIRGGHDPDGLIVWRPFDPSDTGPKRPPRGATK